MQEELYPSQFKSWVFACFIIHNFEADSIAPINFNRGAASPASNLWR